MAGPPKDRITIVPDWILLCVGFLGTLAIAYFFHQFLKNVPQARDNPGDADLDESDESVEGDSEPQNLQELTPEERKIKKNQAARKMREEAKMTSAHIREERERIVREQAKEREYKLLEEAKENLTAQEEQREFDSWRRSKQLSNERKSLRLDCFLNHLILGKIVCIDHVAEHFGWSRAQAERRFNLLVNEGDISGIIEHNCFVVFSEDMLLEVAAQIEIRGRVSILDLTTIPIS